jgi:hypothetical protein
LATSNVTGCSPPEGIGLDITLPKYRSKWSAASDSGAAHPQRYVNEGSQPLPLPNDSVSGVLVGEGRVVDQLRRDRALFLGSLHTVDLGWRVAQDQSVTNALTCAPSGDSEILPIRKGALEFRVERSIAKMNLVPRTWAVRAPEKIRSSLSGFSVASNSITPNGI